MTSVNLGKPPQYLKIKESLRSENIIKKYLSIIVLHYYIVIFLYVFLYPERVYTSTK